MARQSGVSTPIFDELLREMVAREQAAPAQAQPGETQASEQSQEQAPTTRRRHRAE